MLMLLFLHPDLPCPTMLRAGQFQLTVPLLDPEGRHCMYEITGRFQRTCLDKDGLDARYYFQYICVCFCQEPK